MTPSCGAWLRSGAHPSILAPSWRGAARGLDDRERRTSALPAAGPLILLSLYSTARPIVRAPNHLLMSILDLRVGSPANRLTNERSNSSTIYVRDNTGNRHLPDKRLRVKLRDAEIWA